MSRSSEEMLRHYEQGGLLERIVAGLKALGKDLDSLTHDDLAPADEFHSQGRSATRALAELAQIPSGSRVLDVGSGLGGPARYLAANYGCDVTGIDLTKRLNVHIRAEFFECRDVRQRATDPFRRGDRNRADLAGRNLRNQTGVRIQHKVYVSTQQRSQCVRKGREHHRFHFLCVSSHRFGRQRNRNVSRPAESCANSDTHRRKIFLVNRLIDRAHYLVGAASGSRGRNEFDVVVRLPGLCHARDGNCEQRPGACQCGKSARNCVFARCAPGIGC